MKALAVARGVFLVSGAFVLVGCGAKPLSIDVGAPGPDGAAGSDPAATITGLHFTTSSAIPDNPPPTNVDVTLTDPAPARAIYDATLALPDFPPGHTNCPADFGYGHTITFMAGPSVAATATLSSGGCRDVTISGAGATRQSNDAYWALLAENLGVEESTLFWLASPRDRLANRDFVSESVEGFDLVAGTQLGLSFRDTSLSGFNGCNSFFGPYDVPGDTLVFTKMGSTGIGCSAGLMAEESWFDALLANGPTLAIEEPRLVLTAPGTKVTFIDRKIASP